MICCLRRIIIAARMRLVRWVTTSQVNSTMMRSLGRVKMTQTSE